jgi:hypothetical protein
VASRARLNPYVRGLIYGMHMAGATLEGITDAVRKPDGSALTQQGAWHCIGLCKANGGARWDGDAQNPGRRPRKTTVAMDKALVSIISKHRGSALVTVAFVKKMLPQWRAVSNTTVERRLGEAGLSYLSRRRKSLVPSQHKAARLRWARWIKRRPLVELGRYAYSDGTVFYLGRTAAEAEDQSRAALGKYVWRQAGGSDALYEDCVGPSSYWKAQGVPVRIWGLLANGVLHVSMAGIAASRSRPDYLVSRWHGLLQRHVLTLLAVRSVAPRWSLCCQTVNV